VITVFGVDHAVPAEKWDRPTRKIEAIVVLAGRRGLTTAVLGAPSRTPSVDAR
jgi:hypothetical protein